jgi:S1-C subfamily serine protease
MTPRLQIVVAAAIIVGSGCVAAPPAPTPPPSLPGTRPVLTADSDQQRAAEITVRVRNRGCDFLATGSGFAVTEHLLVTNQHVVEGADELQLDTWEGRSVRVTVHSVTYLHDLAIIETAESLPRVARLAASDPEPGSGISVVGFPAGGPLRQRSGTVIDVVDGAQFDDNASILRIDARVEHGNSGGPLLDLRGRVVGVVYAVEKATGYGFAIPVSSLKRVLDDYTVLSERPDPCSIRG